MDRSPSASTDSDAQQFIDMHGHGPLRHQRGLDGLRGIAVAAVVAFHVGLSDARGGFLAVSLFFTLSGFLITSLLVARLGPTGAVGLRRFWASRMRRLLPAAWLTIAGVAVAAAALDDVGKSLRAELWAAAGQLANWQFLRAGSSYAELFQSPSPVLHFWSLSIEGQFYVVYPLVLWALYRFARRPTLVASLLALAAAVSYLLPIAARFSLDRTYYGTDTRAGEFLIGAVLAVLLTSQRLRLALAGETGRRAVAAAGAAALMATIYLWGTVTLKAPMLTGGGLALVAALSGVLVLAALVPAGPIHRLVTLAPLQWLGQISYGVYLFHWPVLIWAKQSRSALGEAPRLLLAIGGVLAAAALSERYFERPIRQGAPLVRRLVRWLIWPAVAAVALVPLILTPTVNAAAQVAEDLEQAAAALRVRSSAATTSKTAVPTFMAFGDSIPLGLMMCIRYWDRDETLLRLRGGQLNLGCGIEQPSSWNAAGEIREDCLSVLEGWRQAVAAAPPDFALVMSCQWEAVDKWPAGSPTPRHLGDAAFDAAVRRDYLAAADALLEAGARVVIWSTCAHFSQKVGLEGQQPLLVASRDPARIDRLNEIIRRVAAERPGRIQLLDWGRWVDARVDDPVLRPDGSHYEWKRDTGVGKEFGSRLLAAWKLWSSSRARAGR